jgi:hypothetical protein
MGATTKGRCTAMLRHFGPGSRVPVWKRYIDLTVVPVVPSVSIGARDRTLMMLYVGPSVNRVWSHLNFDCHVC